MKFIINSIIVLLFLLYSCTTEHFHRVEYRFVGEVGNYQVEFTDGNQVWYTGEGVLGIRVARDSLSDVTVPEYVNYSNYSKVDGGHKAVATIRTSDGSCIGVTDWFVCQMDGVEITREIEVLESGSALGFMTLFPIRDKQTIAAEQRMWFAPSAYYGNNERTFTGRGVKIGFDGKESICPVDVIGVPVIMNYYDGKAFSLTDVTEGHRETVAEDLYANQNVILIDDAINLPGIGLKNIKSESAATVEMYHAYPANTRNWLRQSPDTGIWRMLPLKKGLKRRVAFFVSMAEFDNFDTALTEVWRHAFDNYSVVDKRYAKGDVYRALADNVQRTFGHQTYGKYTDAPQYMVKSDHPYPTSGFLYRNTDLAALMIAAGYRLERQDYIDTAIEVMDYQIKYDLIDTNSPFEHERAQSEGIIGVIEGYECAKLHGLDKPHWLDYIKRKGEEKLKVKDDMVVPLLLKLYEFTSDRRFLDRSIALIDSYDEIHKLYGFQGDALANPTTSMTSREAAAVYLNCYVKLYEYTKAPKYLEHAKRAATYFESTHIAQSINFLTKGTTGYEYRDDSPEEVSGKRFKEMGYLGNSKIMPYGLSYICSPSVGVDMFGAYEIPYMYLMGKFLKDEHFMDFAEYLQYNTTLYVNMGDKHWLMDDLRYSSGMGFINEYIGAAASTDPVSAGRGTMHISNLAWNMYVLLHSYEEMLKVNPDYLADDVSRSYDIAKFKLTTASSEESGLYRKYNAVDKKANTVWVPKINDAEKSLTIHLGEFCRIDNVGIQGFNHDDNSRVTIELSDDGDVFTAVCKDAKLNTDGKTEISVKGHTAMFVKISLRGNAVKKIGIADVEIEGLPLTLKQLQLQKTCTSSSAINPEKALDWNNQTYAQFSSSHNEWLTVDLEQEKQIREIGVFFDIDVNFEDLDHISKPISKPIYRFKVEYSLDNQEWMTYQDCSNNNIYQAVQVFTKAVKARYVRIKVLAVENCDKLRIREFKILG